MKNWMMAFPPWPRRSKQREERRTEGPEKHRLRPRRGRRSRKCYSEKAFLFHDVGLWRAREKKRWGREEKERADYSGIHE